VAARKMGNHTGLPLRFGCGSAALYYYAANSWNFGKHFVASFIYIYDFVGFFWLISL